MSEKWPKELDGFRLTEFKKENGELYAFYYKSGMGFAHAIRAERVRPIVRPELSLIQIEHLSGNAWGIYTNSDGTTEPRDTDKPHTIHWLILRTDYYQSERLALMALTGQTWMPRKKNGQPMKNRKPKEVEPLSNTTIGSMLEQPLTPLNSLSLEA